MINYKTKTEKIIFDSTEWKEMQNQIIINAIKNKQKVDPKNLFNNIFHNEVQKVSQKLQNSIYIENAKNLIPYEPSVNVNKLDAESCDAEIKVTYFEADELNKINYKNIKVDFKYTQISQEELDGAFEKFISNYPLITYVKDKSKFGDYIKLSLKISEKGKIIDSKDDLTLQVIPSKNFSINNLLNNRSENETFSINDPENKNWTITIKEIQRVIPTKLTNDNIQKINMNINSLDDLKQKLERDFLKDRASNELLRFFDKVITQLIIQNNIELEEEILRADAKEFIFNFLKQNQNNIEFQNLTVEKIINSNNPMHNNLVRNAYEISKKRIQSRVIEFVVWSNEKLYITEELVNSEFKHIQNVLGQNNNITKDVLNKILKHQKIALFFAKQVDESLYNTFVKNIGFEL
ncbi:trigger factor-related chaperone [Mycoplasmopsis lipofaciens]|uniref:trigger factor-related chaperone n=1 Tax=Mycoplasmopsis lipofaciens TaxID=114884 RepID=UPI0004855F83|nr:hypothetical protein [Mycoplasmopsis lipofaciens]